MRNILFAFTISSPHITHPSNTSRLPAAGPIDSRKHRRSFDPFSSSHRNMSRTGTTSAANKTSIIHSPGQCAQNPIMIQRKILNKTSVENCIELEIMIRCNYSGVEVLVCVCIALVLIYEERQHFGNVERIRIALFVAFAHCNVFCCSFFLLKVRFFSSPISEWYIAIINSNFRFSCCICYNGPYIHR